MRRIYKYITAAVSLIALALASCTPKPELEWIPQIESFSAEVTDNSCVLAAEVSSDLTDGCTCGFLYGKDEDDMLRVQATPMGKKFSFIIESLDYETEYAYKAFVANGRNEICSDVGYFRTQAPDQTEYSMILPFHTKEVERLSSRFTFEVGGNADFSVTVPEDVDWLRCGTSGRTCIVFVETNNSEYPRSCGIVFKNLFNKLFNSWCHFLYFFTGFI